MLTHTDTDHVSYLDEVVDAFDVNNIFMPNVLSTPNMSKWSEKDKNRFNSIPQEKKDMFTDEDTISTEQYASFLQQR